MTEYPTNQETVFVQDLDKEITLREMTAGYISKSHKNKEFDTPRNAMKMCGLDDDEIDTIGMGVLNALYEAVAELTYPSMRAKREQEIKDGTYVAPTDKEIADAKKN